MRMLRSRRWGIASVVVISVRLLAGPGFRPATSAFEFGLDLEAPQRVGPHLLEQLAHRPEPFPLDAVVAVAPGRPYAHQPRLRQRPELQRYGAERHVGEGRIDGAGRELLVPEQPQDFPPPRRGDCRKQGRIQWHARYFI